jgi:hypothetical protein
MELHITCVSEEQFAELVELVRTNHADTSATLLRLGEQMANLSEVLQEVAAGLRGPLATSILDLIASSEAKDRRIAELTGSDVEEDAAIADVRDAFGEVAGLFADDDVPADVEPLPETPAEEPAPAPDVEEPAAEETGGADDGTGAVTPEPPAVEDEPAPAEEPAADEVAEDATVPGGAPEDNEEGAPVDEASPAEELSVEEGETEPTQVDTGEQVEPGSDEAGAAGASGEPRDDGGVEVLPAPGGVSE